MTRWQRFTDSLFTTSTAKLIRRAGMGMMLGTLQTPYERHVRDYIRTGESEHLERALRHIV